MAEQAQTNVNIVMEHIPEDMQDNFTIDNNGNLVLVEELTEEEYQFFNEALAGNLYKSEQEATLAHMEMQQNEQRKQDIYEQLDNHPELADELDLSSLDSNNPQNAFSVSNIITEQEAKLKQHIVDKEEIKHTPKVDVYRP